MVTPSSTIFSSYLLDMAIYILRHILNKYETYFRYSEIGWRRCEYCFLIKNNRILIKKNYCSNKQNKIIINIFKGYTSKGKNIKIIEKK